ncbi:hypothetical protein [Halorarius halobius]|uniref:hypothetical protein n=1 Tax=Halorarius halobius TaxID=2962671 RepID=UPI0020CF4ACB|nr:hypothetical protein [Halorarius halobius]
MSREQSPIGRSWRDVATDLLTAYKTWIALGLAAVVVADATGYISLPTVEVSRPVKIMLLGALGGLLLGWAPASRIVKWLYDPPTVWLLEVDAREDDVALYKLSPQQFSELDVLHGELHRLSAKHELWECQAYIPDRNTAIGTWRGSASDMELIADRERIDELRSHLEQQAQKGLSIRIKVGSIVRDAVHDITDELTAQYEGITIYRGEKVQTAVNDALDDYDLLDEETSDDEEVEEVRKEARRETAAAEESARTNGHETAEVTPDAD